MKIVLPFWGLGNVMFQYAFLCELRTRSEEGCCFLLHKKMRFEHNGYELSKLFKVAPYKGLNFIQRGYIHFVEFLGSLGLPHFKLIRFFFREVSVKENFIYYDDVFQHSHENCYFRGTWQSPLYFIHAKQEILDTFKFDKKMISSYTESILNSIESTPNSVSLHVRRGDYLNPKFEGLSRCCTLEYFDRAIQYMQNHLKTPTFYIFSDDIDYVKENIKAENIIFVDGNKGDDSWQDMFLMSSCHHNIIANSTFSWWGAFLNSHDDKIVIAPKRWWYYFEKDDVVPEEWVRM